MPGNVCSTVTPSSALIVPRLMPTFGFTRMRSLRDGGRPVGGPSKGVEALRLTVVQLVGGSSVGTSCVVEPRLIWAMAAEKSAESSRTANQVHLAAERPGGIKSMGVGAAVQSVFMIFICCTGFGNYWSRATGRRNRSLV